MELTKDRRRAIRRKETFKHINRKRYIIKNIWRWDVNDMKCGSKMGRLKKAKIHCSCPICKTKSKTSPKIRDLKQQLREKDGDIEI